jgi:hypothetical protein
MVWWWGTGLGRAVQGILGVLLLCVGFAQTSVAGLMVMLAGLVFTVLAAAPPAPIRPRSIHLRP